MALFLLNQYTALYMFTFRLVAEGFERMMSSSFNLTENLEGVGTGPRHQVGPPATAGVK